MFEQGKRSVHHDPSKLIMLYAFDLGVLGELGASRFSGTKRVRAKDAKDAKVRKRGTLSCPLIIRFGGREGWRGLRAH